MTSGSGPKFDKARDLHKRVPVITIHDHDPIADDLEGCLAGGISAKVLMPVVDIKIQRDPMATGRVLDGWAEHARTEFREMLRQIADSGGRAFLATSEAEIERAHREGKLAVIMGAEGGKLIEDSLPLLHEFHRMGLRFVGLTWAFPNRISNMDDPAQPGLTAFGKTVVAEMNRLGIVIDIGHAGYRTFFQTLELSSHPIVFSHGGAKGAILRSRHPDWYSGANCFCDDDMLKALAETGGLIGVNFVGHVFHRSHGTTDVVMADVIDHFEYVAERVGVDVLALGCDYFPTHGLWAELQRSQDSPADSYIVRKERLWDFTAALLDHGWSEADLVKILGGNALRVFKKVLGR